MAQSPLKDGELEVLCLQSLLAVLAMHFFIPPFFIPLFFIPFYPPSVNTQTHSWFYLQLTDGFT